MAGEDETVRGEEISAKAPKAKRSDRDVGHALRSAYVETVNEDIPPELLDLLGKLD